MNERFIIGGVLYPPFERQYDQRREGLAAWTERIRRYFGTYDPDQQEQAKETRRP